MPAPVQASLDACLERILQRIDHLRHLDLDEEAGVQDALDESRELMGLLALYRAALQRAPSPAPQRLRHAA